MTETIVESQGPSGLKKNWIIKILIEGIRVDVTNHSVAVEWEEKKTYKITCLKKHKADTLLNIMISFISFLQ